MKRLLTSLLALVLLTPLVRWSEAAPLTRDDLYDKMVEANKLRDDGKYFEAEKAFEKLPPEYVRLFGEGTVEHAMSVSNLATIYEMNARITEAEVLNERALKFRENLLERAVKFGEGKRAQRELHVADSLNNLGALYRSSGRAEKAEKFYVRCLEIYRNNPEARPGQVARAMNNLAIVYKDLKQYDKAEDLYRQAIKLYKQEHGESHPDVANAFNNLGSLYLAMEKYTEAESLYQQALKMFQVTLGVGHPLVGTGHHNLSHLCFVTKRYKEAEENLLAARKIREARLGKDHPLTASTWNGLSAVYSATGRIREAADAFDLARRIQQRFALRTLPSLSEREQLAFLGSVERHSLWAALTLAMANDTPDLSARMAEWLLNAKGLAHQTRAQTLLAIRDGGDPNLAKSLEELLDLRRQLARRSLQGVGLDDLVERERDLAGQLQRQGASVAVPAWAEGKQLQAALKDGTAFIDFVRFEPFDSARSKWGEARYVASLTTNEGTPRLFDLGPAQVIDAAVDAVRESINGAVAALKADGEIDAEKAMRGPLAKLAKLVLAPLRPHLDKSKRWVVCPDGALWLVPWPALPLDEKTFAVEKHSIQLVVSGRDLLLGAPRPMAKSAPVIVADPDFNAAPDLGGAVGRGLSEKLQLGFIRRLEGTADEAEAMREPLARAYGKAPLVYTEEKATAAAVLATKRPVALTLATHGYFLTDSGKNYEDPLLRCGLLLAGCNKPGDAGRAGVLTGREVLSADLRGCELVVLSACETGLGDLRQGEGIAGLRQAFQLSGAESVLATLWRVRDRETGELMVGFTNALADGKDRVEALAEAQRSLIEGRRGKFGAAHPFFWAAFSLTGTASR